MRFRDRFAAILPANRSSLAWAVAAWAGASVGWWSRSWWPAVPLGVAAVAAASRRTRVALVVGIAAAAVVSGAAAGRRVDAAATAAIVPGHVAVRAHATGDAIPYGEAWRTPVRVAESAGAGLVPAGTIVALETEGRIDVAAGDTVAAAGALRDRPGRLRGDPHRALIRDAEVEVVARAGGLWFRSGNALRRFVLDKLEPLAHRPPAGLLAGFLVGDTSRLPADAVDDLRSAGLTHYVAVSGSNVALFLAAWWLVVGPLGLDPRLRAATGLVALGAFVVATRWEPSVVRAAAMAGVLLGGRVVGVLVDPWRALGSAVTLLVLVSGDLVADVGFQLSVGATCGVLIGLRMPIRRRPRRLWRLVTATVAAQLAVVPVLLATFGTVPLLSPIANVVAAPLVTAATALGGAGLAVGFAPVLEAGLFAAGGVLEVARHAAGWPQVGAPGAAAVILAGFAMRSPRLRPLAVAGAVAWIGIAAVPVAPPETPQLVFLDVGQGDAVLLAGPAGTALVDGGRDPDVLAAALRRHGIVRIDLLIVTHGDADHVGGLAEALGRYEVAELWHPAHQDPSPLLAALVDDAHRRGVPVRAVRRGDRGSLGDLRFDVLAPGRRYAAENDGSIVLWVAAAGATALLTGDVEAVAQGELPPLRPEILQVPHHGSATTDLRWLRETVGTVAVISVGPNTFGHPTQTVLDALAGTPARVFLTQRDGDVVIPLS